jgi:heme A synthase
MSNALHADAPARARSPLYASLIGLTALAILLQGVWAGLFIRQGEEYKQSLVDVHARGADIAIVLALAATVVAVLKLRERRDLVIGTAVLVVLLVLEAFIGGLIEDHADVTAIHIPLAMGLMGLAVWLPFRAVRG